MSQTKKTLILDSTQIQAFLECPTYWLYNYRMNITPKVVETKEAMIKGTYGHKLLELYYKNVIRGASLASNLTELANHDMDAECNCECGHAPDSHDLLKLNDTLLPICHLCSSTSSYTHEFKRQSFPLPQPQRLSVLDKVRMYAMTYQSKDFRPHSPETVEVGFSELIHEDSDHLFVLEGKIDLLGQLDLEKVIVDHKFQERAHTLYKKSVQFRNYSMVTGRKLMIINYIRMAKTAEKPFERALVSFSSEEHRWWRAELVKIYFNILKHIESEFTLSDSHKWNRCKGEWGRPCEYTDLCEERGASELINIKIKHNFTKKEEWRPW